MTEPEAAARWKRGDGSAKRPVLWSASLACAGYLALLLFSGRRAFLVGEAIEAPAVLTIVAGVASRMLAVLRRRGRTIALRGELRRWNGILALAASALFAVVGVLLTALLGFEVLAMPFMR